MEAACEAVREQVRRLWGRLAVPPEEREALGEHMAASRRRNLEAVSAGAAPPAAGCCLCSGSSVGNWRCASPQLRAEVERLEELKLLNIRNVTDAIRSELAAFWDKCFFSAEQRRAFAPYASGGLLLLLWSTSSSRLPPPPSSLFSSCFILLQGGQTHDHRGPHQRHGRPLKGPETL